MYKQWSGLFGVLLICSAFIIHFFSVIPQANAAAEDGTLNDPNIQYVGRWDKSSSTVFKSYWGGAYLKVNFTGNHVAVKLAASTKFYASIDDGDDVLYSGVTGTVNLTPTALPNGTHTLRIASASENYSLQFQGLLLDTGAVTQPPVMSNNLIEFVGDSITAGYLNSKTALSDYAWLAGEQLGVEHTQIAHTGICLVDNYHCFSPNDIGMSNQFFKLQTVNNTNSPLWDFNHYQARAVVINIGTNDQVNGVSDTAFQQAYITFLHNVRAKYPSADIFVMKAFNGSKATQTLAAVQTVINAGDSKVHYIDTTHWISSSDTSDGLHPSDAGHAKIANILVPLLKPYVTGIN